MPLTREPGPPDQCSPHWFTGGSINKAHVVSVVEGEHVERRVNQVDRQAVVGRGVLGVDELVLA